MSIVFQMSIAKGVNYEGRIQAIKIEIGAISAEFLALRIWKQKNDIFFKVMISLCSMSILRTIFVVLSPRV